MCVALPSGFRGPSFKMWIGAPQTVSPPSVSDDNGRPVTGKRQTSGRVFQELVDARGRELRALSYERLLVLDWPCEEVRVNGRRGRIGVIVEPCSDDRVRIVVQGFLDCSVLGVVLFSRVALDGFYKHRDNSVTPMKDEEFYGYD